MKKITQKNNIQNGSGNTIRGSKDVNIMHMDAKPFILSFMIWGIAMFLFFAVLAGVGAYVIHDINQQVIELTKVNK